MEEVNVVTIHKLDELTIDVLQGFVVRLQRIYQRRATVQDLLRQDCTTYAFQPRAPLGEVRALMRSSEKKDPIS